MRPSKPCGARPQECGMRVVLDTNILVSGMLSAGGPPGWIMEAVLAGEFEPISDSAISGEYKEVLARAEFSFPPAQIDRVLAALDRYSFQVVAAGPWPIALPDPDDEPFLATASAAGCVLVTGNLRHDPANVRQGVVVLSAREFVNRARAFQRTGHRETRP